MEQLFENPNDAIVMADEDQKVVRINKKFEELFGYSYDEAVGVPVDALIAPDEVGIDTQDSRVDSDQTKTEFLEVRRHKNGSTFYCRA